MTDSHLIERLISDFLRALDVHDWPALRRTLADELRVDFATPRGGNVVLLPVRPEAFVNQRRNSLGGLETIHEFRLNQLEVEDDAASASGRFEIQRFAAGGERHFHSWGDYRFTFERAGWRGWKITSVAQMTWRSDGDAKLYAAA